MKLEYTHPAAARRAGRTAGADVRGARRNGRRLSPPGPRPSVREKRTPGKRRAARSRMRVAAYESRIRLGN